MSAEDYGVVAGFILAVLGSALLFQPNLLIPEPPEGIGIMGIILLGAGIGLIAQYGK